ncbi:hypothetical protein AV649_12935 [Rossellomorea marisflavi]|uniref:Uncharacterized protein n=1 Tax=Rossellomorea marisflavi TaxID=189381 RepID=A0A161RZ89_9BACI|nr:hypothetical protein AV649_12935 [Rossellomorea marisflavi]
MNERVERDRSFPLRALAFCGEEIDILSWNQASFFNALCDLYMEAKVYNAVSVVDPLFLVVSES